MKTTTNQILESTMQDIIERMEAVKEQTEKAIDNLQYDMIVVVDDDTGTWTLVG